MTSIVIVIGGSGALGKSLITHFNSLNFLTVNVDIFANSEAAVNYGPTDSIAVPEGSVELVVNAAGGWTGGDAYDPEFPAKCKKMWEMNVESAILAASLAAAHLKEDGLLVLVGAKAVALHTTPEMLAYAMAKSAVASLAANMSTSSKFKVTLLLPEVLDTEANRKSMPQADTSKWTPVNVIAEKVAEFLKLGRDEINGKSWLIVTRSGVTSFTEKE